MAGTRDWLLLAAACTNEATFDTKDVAQLEAKLEQCNCSSVKCTAAQIHGCNCPLATKPACDTVRDLCDFSKIARQCRF